MSLKFSFGNLKLNAKKIKNIFRLANFFIEVIDSRLPFSSRIVDLKKQLDNKPVFIIFSKYDLSNQNNVLEWIKFLKLNKNQYLFFSHNDSKFNSKKFLSFLLNYLYSCSSTFIEKTTLFAIVVGFPNTGKSSLLRKLLKKKLLVGNEPGITKGIQWFNFCNRINILDTPGHFSTISNDLQKNKLIALNLIKNNLIDFDQKAFNLLFFLLQFNHNIKILNKYFDYSFSLSLEYDEDIYLKFFEFFAKKKKFLVKNKLNITKAIELFLNIFKKNKIKDLIFEKPFT